MCDKIKPFIDFIITQNCNLRCPYCSQTKALEEKLNDASDEVIDGFFSALDLLTDKNIEITITGGEPLLHPRFFEIIRRIKDGGFKVSIVSNFSSSAKMYKEIIDILDDSFSFLMLSFHTHSIKNLDEYIHKALIVKSYTHADTKMRICTPLTDDNLAKVRYIEKRIENTGIEFEAQHVRIKNKYKKYSNENEEYMKQHNFAKNKNLKSCGLYCLAGYNSAVVYQNGEVYRCYSSRLIKSHYLGSIKNGAFNFYKNIKVCPLLKCTCPKPLQYGLITGKKNYFKAFLSALENAVFLPFELIKNKKNIINKIKQENMLNKSCE